jgi:soluble lytic murein transglycosylase-like protein
VRCLPILLFVAGLCVPVLAYAEIEVREDAEAGLVLSNVDETRRNQLAAQVQTQTPAQAQAPARRLRPAGARAEPFMLLVRAAARAHDVPEALLRALIEVESGFNPRAVSPKGAVGLTQLMPRTARALGVADPRDPGANIHGGARYLKDLLARHGNDVALALAAYNAGEAAVQRAGGIPAFAETRAYVPRVLVRYHELQSGSP